MRGSFINKYSPYKLHCQSLSFVFFKQQEKKKRSTDLFGFNAQIIQGSFSCLNSPETKTNQVQSLQQRKQSQKPSKKRTFVLSFHSKQQLNPGTSYKKLNKRIHSQQNSNKSSLNQIFEKQKLFFSQAQLVNLASSKTGIERNLKNAIFLKKHSKSIFSQSKTNVTVVVEKQRTLQRVQPWVANHQTLNETISFKAEWQNEQKKKRKPFRLKKTTYKVS